MECGAKKRDGDKCRAAAMPNGKCRIHGGKSLSGIASPNLTSGRYSKNLPTRMIERYRAGLSDGELLNLREDLALLDARLEDVLAKVDTGECGETWRSLLDAVHEFDKAERAVNSTQNESKQADWKRDREDAMRTIITLCQEGMADYAAWGEVKDLLERRRRIAETEQKRLIAMQQMMTQEQANTLLEFIAKSVRTHVTDTAALANIAADLRTVFGTANSRPSQPVH